MDSVIFQANVLGMLAFIVPALILFLRVIKNVEDKLVERKLYLACGIGVVLGTAADIIMILGGVDLYSTCPIKKPRYKRGFLIIKQYNLL